MVNVNINVNSAAELKPILDLLRKEGLIASAPVEIPVVQDGRAPRATRAEMDLRRKIDARRITNGEEMIDWSDFQVRKQILNKEGFVIVRRECPIEQSEKGELFEGDVSDTDVP